MIYSLDERYLYFQLHEFLHPLAAYPVRVDILFNILCSDTFSSSSSLGTIEPIPYPCVTNDNIVAFWSYSFKILKQEIEKLAILDWVIASISWIMIL
jgi:hypothetical protein